MNKLGLFLGILLFIPAMLDARRYNFGITVEERNHRLMITAINRSSKSFAAGLRRGDFILGVNGRRINSLEGLKRILSRLGNKSLFYISRKGYKKEVLIKFKEDFIYDSGRDSYNIGLNIEEVDEGLFIRNVAPDSVAYHSGLDSGDIIVGANGYRIAKVQHLRLVLEQYTHGELVLYIKRDGRRYKTQLEVMPIKKRAPRRPAPAVQASPAPKRKPVITRPAPRPKRSAPAPKRPEPSSEGSDYDRLLEKFATDS